MQTGPWMFLMRDHNHSHEQRLQRNSKRDPEHKYISRSVRSLSSAARKTAEGEIGTLVFLERLLTQVEVEVGPTNWRRIALGAVLLASEAWDGPAACNVDECPVLKDDTVEDVSERGRHFLEHLCQTLL